MKNTASQIVKQVSSLGITGNVVPNQFIQKIRIPTKKGSKPDFMAAHLLADTLYWYRETKIIDESTGTITEIKNKFAGEYLQRSYGQISKMFDVSKQTAMRAVDRLVQNGLLQKLIVKRLITNSGRVLNNVMYLVPVPSAIKALMTDEEQVQEEAIQDANFESCPSYQDRYHPSIKVDTTYTKTINTNNSLKTPKGITSSVGNTTSASESREKTKDAIEKIEQRNKRQTVETITANEVDEERYPFAAEAMRRFQAIVDSSIKAGKNLNLYLNKKKLTVRPENLPEIETNMEIILESCFEDDVDGFIQNTLINTYNRRIKDRERPANFSMIAGVGMPDYEGFVRGSEMFDG